MKLDNLRQRVRDRKDRLLRHVEYRRLKRVRRKHTPHYIYCKNCGTRLKGMYCHQCGQYALDIEQPFWKYVLQYFENVYQFDGKVWQTLHLLFRRPGFLTREFNAGKINSYVHPLRLFMFLSCLFFLFFFSSFPDRTKDISLNLSETSDGEAQAIRLDSLIYVLSDQDIADYWWDDLDEEERLARIDTTIWFCGDSTSSEYQKIFKPRTSPYRDTLRADVPKQLLEAKLLLPVKDGDTVYAAASDTTYFRVMPEAKKKRELESDMNYTALLSWYSSYSPIILLLLIPVFALLLKFFFRKERMRYMAHLVLALHIHSVSLLLIALNLVWVFLHLPGRGNFSLAMMSLFLLYMWLSVHAVYQRSGWIGSLVKTVFLYGIYMVVMLFTFVGSLAWCVKYVLDAPLEDYF